MTQNTITVEANKFTSNNGKALREAIYQQATTNYLAKTINFRPPIWIKAGTHHRRTNPSNKNVN